MLRVELGQLRLLRPLELLQLRVLRLSSLQDRDAEEGIFSNGPEPTHGLPPLVVRA